MFPTVHGVVSQDGKGAAPPSIEKTGIASWASDGSIGFSLARGGWVFQVGGKALTVTKLRHWKIDSNATTRRVMIHRNSDNAIIAQADIVFAASEADGWKEAAITPVQLAAGTTYTISSRSIAGDGNMYRNPTGVVYASEISLVDDGVFGGTNDNRPTSNSSNNYTPRADFVFTT